MIDRIGKQLGSYRLLKLLGKGGFAEVYLGEYVYLKTLVAIKLLHASLSNEEAAAFQNEARIVAGLEHPHIVRVLDFAMQDETPYLVMEYAPGGSLRTRHPKGSLLPLEVVVPYVRQIADALQYAHAQRLIHRDVKPENMLLNTRDEVLLSDFGIATLSHSSRSQTTEEVVGTAAYMAPEQFLGKPRPASDQYALGIVVYEWLAGSQPFQGSFLEISGQHLHAPPPSLRAQRPDLPPEVEEIVLRALAKDPHDRFPTVQAFADALQPFSSAPAESTVSLVAHIAAPLVMREEQTTAHLPASPTPAEAITSPTASPTRQSEPLPTASAPKRRPHRERKRRPLLLSISALVLFLLSLGLLFGYWLPTQQSLTAARTAASRSATATGMAQQGTETAFAQVFAQAETATAAAQQATTTAHNATATAQQIPPTLPYRVQVPGPCPGSNAAWSSPADSDQLDCQADRLTLKGGSLASAAIFFTLNTFPQNFQVSIDVSHFIGKKTSLSLQINGTTQGYFFAFTLGPGNTMLLVTGFGNNGGGPQLFANLSRTNTIAIKIRGRTGSYLLNGAVANTVNLPQQLITTNITITLTGDPNDQVDLQNFTITPIS